MTALTQVCSVSSLVVFEQVIKLVLQSIDLPVAAVRVSRVHAGDLRQFDYDLLLWSLLSIATACVNDGFGGVTLTIRLVGCLIFLIIIVVVIVG